MASYLEEVDRHCLPSIRRSGRLDSARSRKITSFDDGSINMHRYRSASPTYGIHSEIIHHPRPPSPQRRAVTDLQDQVRSYKEAIKSKDALIQQLSSMESVASKVQFHSSVDPIRTETFMGERHAVETARSENAALQVKNEKLQMQVAELKAESETKEIKMKEFKAMYEASKENESRLSVMLESHRQQILELKGKAGSFNAAVDRSEYTVAALQKQVNEEREKVLHLESRLRDQIQERGQSELKITTFERKYHELVSRITAIFHEEGLTGLSVEDVLMKLTDTLQENATLKGKIVNLNEALNTTELKTKASRETIMRLASDVAKEQKVTTRFTSEIDNLRMERDAALGSRRSMEREIELLKEQLDASHRALQNCKSELEVRENRLLSLDREYREKSQSMQYSHSQLHVFKDNLVALLGFMEHSDMSEEAIKCRISEIIHRNRDLTIENENLQDHNKTLTDQLEGQYELQKTSASRARKAESQLVDMEERLRIAEGELTAGDVLRDGMRSDKETYYRTLQRLGEIMKMDNISLDLGLDMTAEALMARAQQLIKMEKDTLADKSTQIYNLMRKVKSQKEQLQNKTLHMDLLKNKMASMEEEILGKTEVQKEKEHVTYRIRKLEKVVEKYKLQNQDLRSEVTSLKAQLLSSSEIQIRTMEQRKELEEMAVTIAELEQMKDKQSRKISKLREEVHIHEHKNHEKSAEASNTVQALSSELRATKNALSMVQNREKQLCDLRTVLARMLGLDLNTLALPDYEIITRLRKLIQSHHNHAFTTLSMEEALADIEEKMPSSYEDYVKTSSSSESTNIARSRERARRKAVRSRARSMSPVRRVRDHRVY